MNVKISVNSEKLELSWEVPEAREGVPHQVICESLATKSKRRIPWRSSDSSLDVALVAGETYKVEVVSHRYRDYAILSRWNIQVRAEFSSSELKSLMNKCFRFIAPPPHSGLQMREIQVVYRCKPKAYWDNIYYNHRNIMHKYIKDNSGQPGNLINGKINGLFFSAQLTSDGSLPQSSVFGNVRMTIPAGRLLCPSRHNFYFADFYCNTTVHYVTIVICVIDSSTDRYCKDHLIKLDPYWNQFVKLVPEPSRPWPWKVFVNYAVYVELFFTEDLPLGVGHFENIMATGNGSSRIQGVPNNKWCDKCNLYPMSEKVSSRF